MHAAPISSQRTSLRVFVRLDAHHLLMVAKEDREKLGGIGGKTLRFRISQKVQVSGRVSRLVLFRGEVGLETGGQGRAGGLTAQMATRGHSDGHAGHLSREDLSSTRRGSLRRQLSFSAHDFFGYHKRTCTHNLTLAHVGSKIPSLGVVSGRRGDSATWWFCS